MGSQDKSSRKKRVMVIMALSSFDGSRSYGGVDSVCQSHLEGLLRFGGDHDYRVVAFNPANDTAENGAPIKLSETVTVHLFNLGGRLSLKAPAPKFIRHELVVREMVKRYAPDVVHSHAAQWYIRKWSPAKKIITLHTYKGLAKTRVNAISDYIHLEMIQPHSIFSCDAIATVSEDIRSLLQKECATPVHYIPNPVAPQFAADDRQSPGVDRIRLLCVSNIEQRKRIADALEVVRELKKTVPEIQLLVAGRSDGGSAYYQALLSFVAEHKLEENVQFLGNLSQQQLRGYLQTSHIGLFMSESETFGLAPLEILMAGVPLITTQVAVFDWHRDAFAERGVTLIQPGDVMGAVRAISERITKGDYRADERAVAFIKEQFSLEAIMKRYVELYSS
jgi:polysaccharide biosynthesis protein VpsD